MDFDAQTSGPSQLESVVTILLQGGHLPAVGRLAWFGTSKGLAELVLRHAACTLLTLATQAATSTAATGGSNSIADSTAFRKHADTAQQLAAQSDNVTLVLHGGLLTPSACLWQCITTLQLHDIQLSQSSVSQLCMPRLPLLHTLGLMNCSMAYSCGRFATDHSTTIRSLECITCADGFLWSAAFELVDPSQLQSLITDEPLGLARLPQMPALQVLHMHAPQENKASAFFAHLTFLPQLPALQELHIADMSIHDQDFQQLLAHPRLARVQLPASISLQHSHVDTLCAWDSLHLTEGVALVELARMPLAGIQSCIVHDCLWADRFTETAAAAAAGDTAAAAAISNINGDNAQRLVFQASSDNLSCFWTPPEPCFEVLDTLVAPQVITSAMRHLAPGTALVLDSVNLVSSEVLASLTTAPSTLTTLCVCPCWTQGDRTDIDADIDAAGTGLLTHMPHVQHMVLGVQWHQRPLAWWLRHIRQLVAGVSRPLQLTLAVRYCREPWQEFDQATVRQWVAAHASEHVKVEFQG